MTNGPESFAAARDSTENTTIDTICGRRVARVGVHDRSAQSSIIEPASIASTDADSWPSRGGAVAKHISSGDAQLVLLCPAWENWMFLGSDNGGKAAAILYSQLASAKANQVEPFVYVRDLLVQFSSAPPDDLSDLLPDQWLQKHRDARRRWPR